MKTHNYIPRPAKVVAKTHLSDDVVALRLKFTDRKPFNFIPGQFVMLSIFGVGEVPIGLTTSPDEKVYIEVAIRATGKVTNIIFALEVGDSLGVSGPFGNGFPLNRLKNRNVVIIGGGIGIAPLRSLIRQVERDPKLVKSLTILNGDRCEERLLYQNEYKDWEKFAKLHLTVDSCGPRWKGCTGNITQLFERAKIERGSIIIACGPPAMFPAIVKRYAGKTVDEKDLYFLLERRMKCGIGKCQHCTCGELYVCLDGPVFTFDRLKYNQEAFK